LEYSKKKSKILFLCHKIAWIQIRIRIRIRILQKGLDPDPCNKYTDPQHWYQTVSQQHSVQKYFRSPNDLKGQQYKLT